MDFLFLEMIAETLTGPLGDSLRDGVFVPNDLNRRPDGRSVAELHAQVPGPELVQRGPRSGGRSIHLRRYRPLEPEPLKRNRSGPQCTQWMADFHRTTTRNPVRREPAWVCAATTSPGRVEYGHTGVTGHGSGVVLYDSAKGITVAVLPNQSASSHGSAYYHIGQALLAGAIVFQK